MKRKIVLKLSVGLLILSIVLTACGGGQSAPPPVATQPPAATQAPAATQSSAAAQAPTAAQSSSAAQALAPSPQPYVAPAFTSKLSAKSTADGFDCPEPNPR